MPNPTQDLFKNLNNQPKPKRIYTVSEIAQDIKLILENSFGEIWIEGEVSNFSAYASGHFYFSLKDQSALISAVMFNSANKGVKFKIEDGLKVICFGRISSYGVRSQYQIIVEIIEPKGIGSLQLALEQLKKKLEREGLFKAGHKRPIPYLPYKIGLVTSLSGAAVKDILKVLDRRFSDIHIIINPAQVQGEGAKEEIAEAINNFNLLNEGLPAGERIEVMIVGRGGGSIEDLWAFNEEVVARAIYNSKIPIISAVGHERDWTIADLVSDLRAPTPSVAAELVIPKKEDLRQNLADLRRGLMLGVENILESNFNECQSLQKRLALLNPVVLLNQHKTKIADLARQIYIRTGHYLKLRQAEFTTLIEKLSGLSPLNILGRGYSITFKMPEGQILKNAKSVAAGDILKTKLHKGEIVSQIQEVNING